jgi:hypothetical protein
MGLCPDKGYAEVDQRVREESAVLYDLERKTPIDHDAIAKQRAALKAAMQARRNALRQSTATDSRHGTSTQAESK